MGMPIHTRAAAIWFAIALIGAGACAAVGLLFGQAALWGSAGTASVLYMGAIAIWFARRDSSTGKILAGERPFATQEGVLSPVLAPSSSAEVLKQAGKTVGMEIGSTEFADLIHALAKRIDDPVDITDTAKRAGLRMELVRTGGTQTPLNLWTAILTRAVKDGRVEQLMAEARRSGAEPPGSEP
jgi:hypothetical protein